MVGDSLGKSMFESLWDQLRINEERQEKPSTPALCKHWEDTGQVEQILEHVAVPSIVARCPSTTSATSGSRWWEHRPYVRKWPNGKPSRDVRCYRSKDGGMVLTVLTPHFGMAGMQGSKVCSQGAPPQSAAGTPPVGGGVPPQAVMGKPGNAALSLALFPFFFALLSTLCLLPCSLSSLQFYLPWLTLIKTWGVKAVLLNRGAHITPTPLYKEELDTTMMVLRERHPDLLILFRATNAGHLKCENIEASLEAPQPNTNLPFNWSLIPEQNVVAREIVEKYGGVFLDIEPMTQLRGDGHRLIVEPRKPPDCLHYCNPGPSDWWNRLLQNALSRIL